MARLIHKLSAAFVASVRQPGKYMDGSGLLYRVYPSGARCWEQRITVKGRRRTYGLGGYPTVSLKKARKAALRNLRRARSGKDPEVRAVVAERVKGDGDGPGKFQAGEPCGCRSGGDDYHLYIHTVIPERACARRCRAQAGAATLRGPACLRPAIAAGARGLQRAALLAYAASVTPAVEWNSCPGTVLASVRVQKGGGRPRGAVQLGRRCEARASILRARPAHSGTAALEGCGRSFVFAATIARPTDAAAGQWRRPSAAKRSTSNRSFDPTSTEDSRPTPGVAAR